jgi:hypothetical protein
MRTSSQIVGLKTDEDLQKCVKARNDFAKHQIVIDGKNVENVEQYRTTTDFYNMTFPKDNMSLFLPAHLDLF